MIRVIITMEIFVTLITKKDDTNGGGVKKMPVEFYNGEKRLLCAATKLLWPGWLNCTVMHTLGLLMAKIMHCAKREKG